MEEIFSADGSDLALSKESRDGDLSQPFLHDGAVMMAVSEESFPAPAATEKQRP